MRSERTGPASLILMRAPNRLTRSLPLPVLTSLPKRIRYCLLKGFNSQPRGVLFSTGQSVNRIQNVLPRQLLCLSHAFSLKHLSQCRCAHKSGRTTISEKAGGFNAAVFDAQAQAQAITTDGIGFFADRILVRQFTSVTRVGQMIFE